MSRNTARIIADALNDKQRADHLLCVNCRAPRAMQRPRLLDLTLLEVVAAAVKSSPRHLIKAHFGTRFGDWAMREVRLITYLRPRLNCVGSIRPRKNAQRTAA